ncbi:MAG: fasciclin domain-containing protein, partial [Planctomycetes bacterium]|nr:fasciclin domain-containing protein [Planctomycetota bacterium]
MKIQTILLALCTPALVATLPAQAKPAKQDIVSLAAGNAALSTLVTAVKTAGLVDTLRGKGPFTVFAPTNAAFAALPPGALSTLLANP